MVDVSLSYAREDERTIGPIARALESEGFSVFWDRKLVAGEDFRRSIERKLGDAGCVVVAWSRSAVDSDWVRDEATAGMDRGVLVPVVLDGATPPVGFRSLHTVSMAGWGAIPRTTATPTRPRRSCAGPATHSRSSASTGWRARPRPISRRSSRPAGASCALPAVRRCASRRRPMLGLLVLNESLAGGHPRADLTLLDGRELTGVIATLELGEGYPVMAIRLEDGGVHRLDFSTIGRVSLRLADGAPREFGTQVPGPE